MGFDVEGALSAGFSEDEINSFAKAKGMSIDVPKAEPVSKPLEAVVDKSVEAIEPPTAIVAPTVREEPTVEEPVADPTKTMVPEAPIGFRGELMNRDMTPYDPEKAKKQSVEELKALKENEEIKDISSLVQNIHGKYSTGTKSLAGAGGKGIGSITSSAKLSAMGDEAMMDAQRDILKLNKTIVNELTERKIDAYVHPETGKAMYRDSTGKEQEITSDIVNDIYNSKYENMGAIGLGTSGAMLGGKVAGFRGAVAGGIIGTAAGVALGKSADMVQNAAKLKEELDYSMFWDRVGDSVLYDTITGVVGGVAMKAAWVPIKGSYDIIAKGGSGSTGRALEYLKNSLNISDDQAMEITEAFVKSVNNNDLETKGRWGKRAMTDKEKQILAISQTQPGAEAVIGKAASENQRIATVLKQSIDDRAKSIHTLVDNVADENVGDVIIKDIKKYEEDVKAYYGQVRDMASGGDIDNFRFDEDKLGLRSVMKNIESNIKANPNKVEQFANMMADIQEKSNRRDFVGLLDLRQAVNEFKHSKLVSKTNSVKGKQSDFEAVNSVLGAIDTQIDKAAKEYMPDTYNTWKSNWKSAKEEYAKMYTLRENTIVRYVNRNASTEAGIQRILNSYGNNKNVDAKTFNAVVERVSPSTRAKMDGAAIKNLLNKHTVGSKSEAQVINFPALNDELKNLNIITPQGKYMTSVVDELANVYKNDIQLSALTGNIRLPSVSASLATSVEGKVKANLVRQVFDEIRTLNPLTDKAKSLTLVKSVKRLMNDPLLAKNADDLIKSMPEGSKEEMRSLVKQLQIEVAKDLANPSKLPANQVYMYQTGNTLRYTNGVLGKGAYLTDKVADPSIKNINRMLIDTSKLATLEDASNIMNMKITDRELRSNPKIQEALVDKGFVGIKDQGKMVLFKEDIIGSKRALQKRAIATLDDVSNIMNREVSAEEITNNPEIMKQVKEKGFKGIEVNGEIVKGK